MGSGPDFIRFHQSLSLEGPRAIRRPLRCWQVLARPRCPKCNPRASDGLQNAVLEPPMASRSPNYANVCKTLLIQQAFAKFNQIILMFAKFRLQKDSNFIERVSRFKLFTVLWSSQPSGIENDRKRSPRDTANRRKALQELPDSSPSALQRASESLQNVVLELPMASRS